MSGNPLEGKSDPTVPAGPRGAQRAAIGEDETVRQDATESIPPDAPAGPRIRITPPAEAFTKLGRYTIVKLLGLGGMGAVFEAHDAELDRGVAIKVLRDDRESPELTEGLRREAQLLARLVHPNIVAVYDVGVDQGQLFVVMQLIDGESIDKWLQARSASPREIVAAFRDAGRGLVAAHAANLVHCDFKPGNVLVDRDGVVRVGDFGIARIGAEATASIAGTPRYMAPEQFGGIATAASDQYSFCVSLWEVLAGEPPFPDTPLDAAGSARARTRPELPRSARVPGYVVRALLRGLAQEPGDRFPSMQALLDALAPPRRTGLAIGAGLAVVAGGVLTAWSFGRAAPARPEAPRPPPPPAPKLDLAHARALTHYGMSACAYSPAVLADGAVVFDRQQADAVDLYAVPLTGGAPRQLTHDPGWEWRPSRGRRPGEVIYLKQDTRAETGEVAAFDLATGASSRLADAYATDAAVAGDAVFYALHETGRLIELRGGRESTIADVLAGMIAASPAGDRLAGVEIRKDVYSLFVLDVASQHVEHLKPQSVARPAFGHDGGNLYYESVDGIHRRDLTAQTDELAAPDVHGPGGLAVVPDGSALVYSGCETRTRIVDASDADRELVTDPTAKSPAIGGDGTLIWTRRLGGTRVLMARRPDGHELQLTDVDFGFVSYPTISEDGHAVVFVVYGKNPGVYLVDLASTQRMIARLTDNANDARAVWANNEVVVVLRRDNAQANSGLLYAVHTDRDAVEPTGVRAFNLYGGARGRVLASSSSALFWYDVTTGKTRAGPVTGLSAFRSVHLSADGAWAEIEAGAEAMAIWRMRLSSPGKAELVEKLPSDIGVPDAAISNDGHAMVTQAKWSGDLFVIPAAPGTKL